MEQERTCKTCKHWDGYPLRHPQAVQQGDCNAIDVDTGDGSTLTRIVLNRDEDGNIPFAYLVTRDSFGCNMWEARSE